MSRRALWLYVGILVILYLPSGLLAVFPVYAQRLGASPAVAGYYLAFSFLALAISTLIAPGIVRRMSDARRVIILLTAAEIPLLFLQGYASDVWQLFLLTGVGWFLFGIVVVIINVAVGFQAGASERGKVFGILGVGSPMGGLVGGLVGSALLAQGGFRLAFSVYAGLTCLAPLMALALAPVSIRVTEASSDSPATKPVVSPVSDGPVNALVAASIAGRFSLFVGIFGIAFVMLARNFSPAEISLAGVAGSGAGIVAPALFGWLSDRIGRRPLLIACYVSVLIGQIGLVFGTELWQFTLVFALRGVGVGGMPAIGSALLTDMAPRDRLPRALAWWGNGTWIGGVLAYAFTGNSIELLGIGATLWVAIALMTLATVSTAWLLWRKPRPVAAPAIQ